MHAREAIVELLDTHVEEVGLTRRQVGDLSGVNAGQLTNWLRTGGPLATLKEGKVAQVVLDRVEVLLRKQPPPQGRAVIERLAAVLHSYGPRRRLLACDPKAAQEGEPIAPENPLFLSCPWHEQVLAAVTTSLPVPVVVSGGPKTGKSTLLYWLQQQLERRQLVLYLDLKDYIGKRPEGADEEAAWKGFYNWVAARCEDQVAGVGYGAVWNEPEDFIPWLDARILRPSRATGLLLILDHLDRLGEHYTKQQTTGEAARLFDHRSGLWEFNALDQAVRYLVEASDKPLGLPEVRIVTALDYHGSKGCPIDRRGSSLVGPRTLLLPYTSTSRNIAEAGMGDLLRVAHPDTARSMSERGDAFRFTGGQVYLAQTYAHGAGADESKANVLAKAQELAGLARDRWHDENSGVDDKYSTEVAEEKALRGAGGSQPSFNSIADRTASKQARRVAIDTGLWQWVTGKKDAATGTRDHDAIEPAAAEGVIEAFLKELGNAAPGRDDDSEPA